jgi:uncharacterized protein
MPKPGRDCVDARALGAEQQALNRRFRLDRFERLAESLLSSDGSVEVEARFHAVEGRPAVELTVSGELVLRCQRCLGPLRLPVTGHAWLAFDAAGEGDVLLGHDDYEVVPSDPAAIDLVELVEDELLLSVPLVPLHEDCGAAVAIEASVAPADEKPPTQRPFAGLKDLLKH